MKRATHTGECQSCGARQMLPSGVLAKHGYAVVWNQFSGVCPGSHQAPFEESIELVELSITRAEQRRDALLANAGNHSAEAGPLMFQRYLRQGGPRGTGIHLWVAVASLEWAKLVEGTPRWIERVVFADGTKERPHGGQFYERDLRHAYVSHLRRLAHQDQQYAAWQRQRLVGWAPRALTPRAGEVA